MSFGNADASLREAEALEAKVKRLESRGFIVKWWHSDEIEPGWPEVVKAYEKAAKSLRSAQRFEQEAKIWERAAAINIKEGSHSSAVSNLSEAFKAYKRVSPEDALRVGNQAAYLGFEHSTTGPAKMEDVARYLANELGDRKGGIEAYTLSLLWDSDLDSGIVAKRRRELGELLAAEGDYQAAIDAFDLAFACDLKKKTWKWRDDEFAAGICHLVLIWKIVIVEGVEGWSSQDGEAAFNDKVADYCARDPPFHSSREYKLLENLRDSILAMDSDRFAYEFGQYDRLSPFDAWKMKILLAAKTNMPPPLTTIHEQWN